ncbi:acyl-CoA dehydrogenase [Mycolicibacterium confluentis]|uniref:Acyl-CoA dehydrogenase FadE22 n=1 Tax=Mycolicibacterium confluentis TaxID=28047 RepID=A0A7I7XZJ1_9MYCO|nr:acyl-CoA dehydrogenase [Mycolicibacterium confluentis]MCV7319513.1 acyl-CoA dehydrogenase [Mycolicibacterium confluentis]ORV34141.1 acyl-CoA dehydrogenase [Mycolicibacterium confluentis]BBZ34534.1 acyl-CoA dehydrogenase FadE22 [Mycolicibacterium confluentis]
MGIALTDDHRELADVARSFLTAQKARAAARELLDAPEEARPAFWDDLAGVGWLGLAVPEEHGGSGYGLPELVVVVEELGRAVAPGPFVPTVTASATIAAYGSAEQQAKLLPGLIDGSRIAAVGFGGDLTVAGGKVSGDAGVVLGAGLADVLLLAAGDDVLVIDRAADGVKVEVPANLDPTRRSGRVVLTDVAAQDVLAGARDGALARARALFAAEAAGGASDCVDSAVEYAKVREQFGRTIATFQAVKHHCANMAVAAESSVALAWDAARAAAEDADDAEQQFQLMAASAAALAFPAYVRNSELNIQVHGGIGFTWEHDAHLHLRRALSVRAVLGGDAPAVDVFDRTEAGVKRANSLDLPPEAETLRVSVRADVEEIAGISDEQGQLDKLITTGYVMPHWPKPFGRAANAVEQLVIDQEFRKAGVKRPDYSITGWVILTLIQHGTPSQIERFVDKALRKEEIWCQLFSEPDAGSDAAGIKTRATRVEGGWKINGQKVWTSGAHYCRRGLATVRTDFDVPKHAGITTVIIDMKAPGVEVRPLRMISGGSEFNEVFFNDVFVPDEDVVGEPNTGWTVARATLGNERVSIGGGSGVSGIAAETLIPLVNAHPDRVAGAKVRVGTHLADEHAVRLLNLRRAVRSIEGAGPGPEGNITKLKIAEGMNEHAAIAVSLYGADAALFDGPASLATLMAMGARGMAIAGGTSEVTRNQIAERILGMPRDPLIK